MNLHDVVREIASDTGVNQEQTRKVLDALTNIIEKQIGKDENVVLMGLGVFKPKHIPSRTMTHPKSGEVFDTVAKKSMSFKLAKSFKDRLNQA